MIGFQNKYKTWIWPIIWALLFFALFNLFQEIFGGEARKVHKFIRQAERVVEKKNLFVCVNMISNDYADNFGNDRQSLTYLIKEIFGYYRKLFIRIEKIEIELGEEQGRAHAEILASVIGEARDNSREKIMEGERGKLKIRLKKEEREWKLLEVESFDALRIMGESVT